MGLMASVLWLGGCPLLNQFLDAPESAFEGAPTAGEAPLTVLFTDASEAGSTNITEWQWDFGDGSTSMLRNPSHIYTAPGNYTVSLTVTSSVGTHTALRRDYIKVVEKPDADFTAFPLSGGAPLSVSFADTSSPGSAPITAWEWNFGDRSPIGTEQNPNHVYTAPGLYTVSLTVTTTAGTDKETKVQFVNVAGAPVADFTSDFSPGVAPLTVKFTDASATGTATVLSRAWEFGDGGLSAEQNPSHTYTASGVYSVSLTLETTAGTDKVTKARYITVEQGPDAAFSGTPLAGPAPLSVLFTDESTPGTQAITRRQWDFGDGGLLSTQTNPTRVYTAPGKYDVSLRVTTPAGTDTLLKPDYVTVTPAAAFSANPATGKGSLSVQFTDQSDLGKYPASAYTWSFGDGKSSAEPSPTHTYEAPGVYDVTLAITTELGESVSVRPGMITVSPDAAFSAAPVSGAPPLNVAFKDETVQGAITVSGWSWSFGDGASSTEQNPSHAYTVPGRYTVALQTTTAAGVDTEQKAGLVEVKPVVDFAVDSPTGQGSLTAAFEDTSNAGNLNVLGWHWDFGDGASSAVRNPTHTYDAIGTYDVALTITTAIGDERIEKADFIRVGPRVDFSADKVAGTGALSVAFTDKTDPGTLEIASWKWDFGDGKTSDEQNPQHDYAPGLFDVGLTVTTSQGESATVKEALILVSPEVVIGVVQPTGPAPFEASLLDLTQVGAFVVEGRLWELGDGATSEEKDPVHIYEAPGKYTVKLTLITNGGEFSKTIADYITAQRGPTAAFSHTVIRGGNLADPVTVSYVSMALPGDAPILNQEWDFGESAIATEEAATEANPTVTYPGTLFDTVPQDVSLTVRTVIAENVLIKENLFGAPVAKSIIPEELLGDAVLTAIATDASGDVWAIGSAESPIVLRMNPDGGQRWGVALEPEARMTLHGVHAPGDGTVYVAGETGKTAWIGRFDARGELLWEFRLDDASASSAMALSTRGDGTVVCGVRRADERGGFDLQLVELDERGRLLASNPAMLALGEGDRAQIAIDADEVLAMVDRDSATSVVSRLATGQAAWTIVGTVESGPPLAISWAQPMGGTVCAVGDRGRSRIVRVAPGGMAETLLNVPSDVVAISACEAGSEVTWLLRDGDDRRWELGRERIGE